MQSMRGTPDDRPCCHCGEILIPVVNNSNNAGKNSIFYIYTGMRIAQAIIAPVKIAKFIEVVELKKTNRGADGFGSTGD